MKRDPNAEISEDSRRKVARTAYTRLMILKWRQKISFLAFKKKFTVLEMICYEMIKSWEDFTEHGVIWTNPAFEKKQIEIFRGLMDKSNVSSALRLAMLVVQFRENII